MDLTNDEWTMIAEIEDAAWRGRGKRVSKSKERDRLKRLGLIASSPPNAGFSRSIAGHAHVWRPTETGLAALKARAVAA